MLRDLGSRDRAFIAAVKDVREKLVEIAGGDVQEYTAVPMQGSGTFGMEAVIGSTVPPGGKLLVMVNGAYGRRMVKMAEVLGIETAVVECAENVKVDPAAVAAVLEGDEGITNAAVVHCETTTGIVNPVREIGGVVKRLGRSTFVDAMSSFGAIPVDVSACGIDYLVSSANKCIEGVPGFSFVIARLSALQATAGYARSLSLDLRAQWEGLEKNGQFRFTPPTHALLAFRQALAELEEEGGVPGRAARYRANYETLIAGMRDMGFSEYLAPEDQGYIITSFLYPDDPGFAFEAFYEHLNRRGFVIYPGKVSDADCFRIGTIGRIDQSDIRGLLCAIRETLVEMGVGTGEGRHGG